MAKRKKAKRATKKSAPRVSKTRAKKVAKKSSAKKPTKKRLGTSVDGILNRYKKERAIQEAQLVAVRKKISDLEAKTRAFQEQIAKLDEQESATLRQVEQLDAKRDQEVSELLSRLGVRVGREDSIPVSNTPGQQAVGGGSDPDDERE